MGAPGGRIVAAPAGGNVRNRLFQHEWETPSGRMIREHSVWLTWALEKLAGGERELEGFPWIPVRPVDSGGFGEVVASAQGRAWADDWWDSAFLDLEESR